MAANQTFSQEVINELGWYVYRLIDPRSGHTFYVGKGKGNRVFEHAQNALQKNQISAEEADYLGSKAKRINEIISAGMDVHHVIHRHKIDSEATAYEIEAALIEAYEGLSNISGGHDNAEKGCAHSSELIRKYEAKELVPGHSLISFSCGHAMRERSSAYEACRFSWRLNRKNIRSRQYALAVDRGFVMDVFEIDNWLPATPENFPGHSFPLEDPAALDLIAKSRTGFNGRQASQDILTLYQYTRLPGEGGQNPVRYFDPVDHIN
jgi:hypothetical protein